MLSLSGRRKKIFFDQTQNERGKIESTYSDLARLLKDNDYDVEAYTEFMILDKKIAEGAVIVFGCPNSSKLRNPEIETLKKYVKSGGSLMLLSLSGGDKGLMNNMSKLSEIFGITFENTAVKDDRNNSGIPTMPIIKDLVPHFITKDVKEVLYPSGCTLRVSGKATILATTSTMADPPGQPIIALAEYGKGRVMCIGSYEIFRKGGGLANKANKVFAVNAFTWLSGDDRSFESSESTVTEEKTAPKESTTADPVMAQEMENTLRRLVNAVFDLQKDISKVREKVDSVEKNIESLRDQFQDFAEKTQDQLGIMIPSKQFLTEEENQAAEIGADIKALEKEIRSVEQLREHIEQRHSSGVMPKESYTEQAEKLDSRVKSLEKKLKKKLKEMDALSEI